LTHAATNGEIDAVTHPIESGAEIEVMNKYGNMALMAAALKLQNDVVELLIKNGSHIYYSETDYGTDLPRRQVEKQKRSSTRAF
jgi:ankyrin repeat protein